jgi:hypothetical protein
MNLLRFLFGMAVGVSAPKFVCPLPLSHSSPAKYTPRGWVKSPAHTPPHENRTTSAPIAAPPCNTREVAVRHDLWGHARKADASFVRCCISSRVPSKATDHLPDDPHRAKEEVSSYPLPLCRILNHPTMLLHRVLIRA